MKPNFSPYERWLIYDYYCGVYYRNKPIRRFMHNHSKWIRYNIDSVINQAIRQLVCYTAGHKIVRKVCIRCGMLL